MRGLMLAGGAVASAAALCWPPALPAAPRGEPQRAPAAKVARAGELGVTTAFRPLLGLGSRRCCGKAHGNTAIAGHSAAGRPIRVREVAGVGAPSADPILVFGCIHGDECAGMRVVGDDGLGQLGCPPREPIWTVRNLNPDGRALGTRLNGRGVDLNRNFPSGWRAEGVRYDPEYPGPRPLSEPETRIVVRLVRAIQPRVTIWFHQQAEPMVRAWGPSAPLAARYARYAHLPFHRLPWLAGTAPNWQNHRFRGASSFVVELPPGELSAEEAERYALAIVRLSSELSRAQNSPPPSSLPREARRARQNGRP